MFVLYILILSSCRKDPSWHTEYEIPLFNDKLTLSDLVVDSLIDEDTNHTAILVIDKDLISITTDSFISLPDSLFYLKYVLPIGVVVPPNTLVLQKTESKYYDLGGPELTQLRIKSGKLYIRAYNYVHDQALIEYTIESSNKNGSPVKLTGLMPSYPLTGKYLEKYIPIDGTFLDLTQSYRHKNSIRSTIKIYANPYADTNVVVNYGDSINILIEFRDIIIDYARGYFGSTQIDIIESSYFSFFKDLGVDFLDLSNVKMKLTLSNYIGADAIFSIDYMTGIGKQTISLQNDWLGKPIHLARALENPPFSGQVIPSEFTIDLSQGNLEEFIENLPSQILFRVRGHVNPLGNISNGNDFVYYGNGLKFHLNAEIPLNLAFSNLTLKDTFDFKMPKLDRFNIEELKLVLNCWNSFPIDAFLNMYILDSQNQLMDSLITSTSISGAFTNSSGFVVAPQHSLSIISVPEEKIEHLLNGSKLMLKAIFSTCQGYNKVHITPESYIDIKIKLLVKLRVE
ncbi:MAG: hypothetical protein N2Z72_06145 [Bacteroidales bacterium]|nr:hypothetical protein [Bacteroidales bacterium]